MANILAKSSEVDLVTLAEKGQATPESHASLNKTFHQISVFTHSKIKGYANAARGVFTNRPLQTSYYWSEKMNNWIKEKQNNYDLIYFNTIRAEAYGKNLETPKVLDMIDAISLNYFSSQKYLNAFAKIFWVTEAKKVLKTELDILKDNRFQKIFIASPYDKKYLEEKSGQAQKNLIALPNGVKPELLSVKPEKEKNWIAFIGKMNYLPNEDAVIYFSKNIFPKLKKESPELKFYIIGTNPSKKVKELEKENGIIVTGFIENPYAILSASKLIVSPLRFGAGIQNKILEAMAMGKTVVTSEIGARGIYEAQNNKNLIILDFEKAEEAAKKIIDIINNKPRREEIGRMAQKLISDDYTWKAIGEKLFSNIKNL